MPEITLAPEGQDTTFPNPTGGLDVANYPFDNFQESSFGGEVTAELPVHESLLDEISSEEGLKKITTAWEQELEDSEMQHIARLEDRIDILNEESRQSDDWRVHEEKDKSIQRIRTLQKQLFGAKVDRYKDIKSMQRYLESNNELLIRGEGSREFAAPFLDTKVMYKPLDGVQRFVKGDELGFGETIATINISKDGAPFEIPLTAIISAAGFESWDGRGTQASSDKINDYATRETEIPPINDQLHALVLPNGRIAYLTENAHRVAAAIKKEQGTIGFSGTLHVHRLGTAPANIY